MSQPPQGPQPPYGQQPQQPYSQQPQQPGPPPGYQGPPQQPYGQQPPPGYGQPQQPLNHRDAKAQARGAKAHAKALRPWFKKKRFILPLALIALIAIISIATAGGGDKAAPIAGAPATSKAAAPNTKAAAPSAEATKPAKKAEKALTAEQQNAVGAAQGYLDFSAFSRKGLIRQLSSEAGDGYEVKDATIAVDSLDINYKEQAAKAAKNYLDTMQFSRKGLLKQLESSAGDGYTHEQAQYGVDHSGL